MRRITLVGILLLAACSSYGHVIPMSDTRYAITASAQSRMDAAESAGARAEDFCADRGERVHIFDIGNGTRFTGPTQVTVVFTCLTP
ncbi:MAG TPA: hypothetical protein VMD03_09615 [Steroidobacteraceae bacterium]|nr:hypothetical protein [Steroidobacteraceae bacterium]